MAQLFIGQLILASFNFAPKGFSTCNGQLLAINSNQALFSLLGTTYGGNGVQTFALPNLQGRTPIGYSSAGGGGGVVLGQQGGTETHTLISSEVPQHTHQLEGTTTGANNSNPVGNVFGTTGGGLSFYTAASGLGSMNAASIGNYGGSIPHENRQPYLVMNWCIALTGIFPTRN
jgi:microcystin-dependent protein